MDNMVRRKLLNYINDPNLLKGLKNVGFIGETYEEAVNWFRDNGVLITIYPSFGDKIGYDEFEIRGYFSEVDLITASDSIVISGGNYVDPFSNSYASTIGLDDSVRREEYRTYVNAIHESVREALKLYHEAQSLTYYSSRIPKVQSPPYPEFGRILYNDFDRFSYMFIKYMPLSCGYKYKIWEKDPSKLTDVKIAVIYDGQEFIVNDSEDYKALENKKFIPCDYKHFLVQLHTKDLITKEEIENYFKDEQAARKYLFGN